MSPKKSAEKIQGDHTSCSHVVSSRGSQATPSRDQQKKITKDTTLAIPMCIQPQYSANSSREQQKDCKKKM
jgi:hypothetical protein